MLHRFIYYGKPKKNLLSKTTNRKIFCKACIKVSTLKYKNFIVYLTKSVKYSKL